MERGMTIHGADMKGRIKTLVRTCTRGGAIGLRGALVWGSQVAKEKLNGDVRGHCYGGGTLGLR